jgi:SRSO17 transposase
VLVSAGALFDHVWDEWDADEVLDDVRDYVVEHIGDRNAVLIVDDTGFLMWRCRPG